MTIRPLFPLLHANPALNSNPPRYLHINRLNNLQYPEPPGKILNIRRSNQLITRHPQSDQCVVQKLNKVS
jgi:hypothetical protein